jgi:hypothetical protein
VSKESEEGEEGGTTATATTKKEGGATTTTEKNREQGMRIEPRGDRERIWEGPRTEQGTKP